MIARGLLLTALLAIVLINYHLWRTPVDASFIVAGRDLASMKIEDQAGLFFEREEVADFSQTHARPLFSESRRPPVVSQSKSRQVTAKPAVETRPERISPPDFSIIGIQNMAGSKKVLIRRGADGIADWLGIGDAADGWRIESVNRSFATFRNGEATTTLYLFPELEKSDEGDD